MDKPAWTFIGTNGNNIFYNQKMHPLAVIIHTMEGTLGACDGWFPNPEARASANFGAGRSGELHCYVDPLGVNSPWANGVIANSSPKFQRLYAQAGHVNPNLWTISIEHDDLGVKPPLLPTHTDAQNNTSAYTTAWLCQYFGIPADRDHIFGHNEIDGVNRVYCPHWTDAQWGVYMNIVNGYLGVVTDTCAELKAQINQMVTDEGSAIDVLVKLRAEINSVFTEVIEDISHPGVS